ncbi:MAG: metallophosphoesterase, partial [Campylobacterales bacterium]|nr:metallophosphoesterase [Campylobacterales bacterium]
NKEKKIKGLITGDLHLKYSLTSQRREINKEYRNYYILDTLTKIVKKEKPDYVVINGDLFHVKGMLRSKDAAEVRECFLYWVSLGCIVIIDTGNHEYEKNNDDFYGKGSISTVFNGLEKEGIFVVDKEARFIRVAKNYVVMAIPYRHTKEECYRDCIEPLQRAKDNGEVKKED